MKGSNVRPAHRPVRPSSAPSTGRPNSARARPQSPMTNRPMSARALTRSAQAGVNIRPVSPAVCGTKHAHPLANVEQEIKEIDSTLKGRLVLDFSKMQSRDQRLRQTGEAQKADMVNDLMYFFDEEKQCSARPSSRTRGVDIGGMSDRSQRSNTNNRSATPRPEEQSENWNSMRQEKYAEQ
eukprot:gene13139-3844_t